MGLERNLFAVLAALLMVMKVVAIYHYRVNVDETQHAHVAWVWATGGLQYRDVFDNHMPLFQAMCAPLMVLLGPRADIIVLLRWAMLPLYLGCLWCVFTLAERLYSRRAAPWVSLAAGALPLFFSTSTEFRPDDLWALLWLLALVVAVSGRFTVARALGLGLLVGLGAAVSVKTAVLLAALGAATLPAIALAWSRREGPGFRESAARLGAMAAGAVIPPALAAGYFAWRGAFWIMYYCVFSHNIVPKLRRWGHLWEHAWIFPAALVASSGVAWLIFRQTRETRLAIRRAIVVLTPWLFLALLLSYWPDIEREDDLPYVPLTPLLAAPLLMWVSARFKFPRIEARFFTWVLPAVCMLELALDWDLHGLRRDHVKVTTQSIADVLLLTGPNDYVLDRCGDYVFRKRAVYWAFETVTRTRIRMGLIRLRLPEALEKTETKMCDLFSVFFMQAETRFLLSNYMPFDSGAPYLAVAGKELGKPAADQSYPFDVAIPATYAVVSESGTNTGGMLDGAPYAGPVRLEAGRHVFQRTEGGGRVAIFLGKALEEGFRPLFDASEKFLAEQTKEEEASRKGE